MPPLSKSSTSLKNSPINLNATPSSRSDSRGLSKLPLNHWSGWRGLLIPLFNHNKKPHERRLITPLTHSREWVNRTETVLVLCTYPTFGELRQSRIIIPPRIFLTTTFCFSLHLRPRTKAIGRV